MSRSGSESMVAGGTIEPRRFVKHNGTDNTVIQATANDITTGISAPISRKFDDRSSADSGEQLVVKRLQGEAAELEVGGTVSAGDRLKSDASGKGVKVATTGTTVQEYGAVADQDGASGDVIRVVIERGALRPALT